MIFLRDFQTRSFYKIFLRNRPTWHFGSNFKKNIAIYTLYCRENFRAALSTGIFQISLRAHPPLFRMEKHLHEMWWSRWLLWTTKRLTAFACQILWMFQCCRLQQNALNYIFNLFQKAVIIEVLSTSSSEPGTKHQQATNWSAINSQTEATQYRSFTRSRPR